MKKGLIAVVAGLFAMATVAEAQGLKKGNLVGTHVFSVKLAPGATMEQFADFYVRKLIPEAEKHFTGWKFYPVKRIRGERAEGFAVIMVIDSAANRDRVHNDDGSLTELGKALNAKIQPVVDELQKIGAITADVYTDWLVY